MKQYKQEALKSQISMVKFLIRYQLGTPLLDVLIATFSVSCELYHLSTVNEKNEMGNYNYLKWERIFRYTTYRPNKKHSPLEHKCNFLYLS